LGPLSTDVVAVLVVVLRFGAEGQANGCAHPGGREVTEVFSFSGEHPDRVVARVRGVKIASLVEGLPLLASTTVIESPDRSSESLWASVADEMPPPMMHTSLS
jgi:hypothetical protein